MTDDISDAYELEELHGNGSSSSSSIGRRNDSYLPATRLFSTLATANSNPAAAANTNNLYSSNYSNDDPTIDCTEVTPLTCGAMVTVLVIIVVIVFFIYYFVIAPYAAINYT